MYLHAVYPTPCHPLLPQLSAAMEAHLRWGSTVGSAYKDKRDSHGAVSEAYKVAWLEGRLVAPDPSHVSSHMEASLTHLLTGCGGELSVGREHGVKHVWGGDWSSAASCDRRRPNSMGHSSESTMTPVTHHTLYPLPHPYPGPLPAYTTTQPSQLQVVPLVNAPAALTLPAPVTAPNIFISHANTGVSIARVRKDLVSKEQMDAQMGKQRLTACQGQLTVTQGESDQHLVLDGAACPEYYRVREVLYSQFGTC